MKSSLFAVLISLIVSAPAFAKLSVITSQDAVAAVLKSAALQSELTRWEPVEGESMAMDDFQVTYRGRGLGKAFTVVLSYDFIQNGRPPYQCAYTFSTRSETYSPPATPSVKAVRLSAPKLEYMDCTTSVHQQAK
jgi:hypothetical protein